MKKNWVFPFLLFVFSCQPDSSKDLVCFRHRCITVEVVDKEATRMRGLQGRETLKDEAGMLFIFPDNQKYSFWMKDTKISLDMIWIDDNRQIVHLEANVPPCSADPCPVYTPLKPSRYVLEVNAGKGKRMGFKVGEQMDFQLKNYLKQ